MTIAETISEKVVRLPAPFQEQVLEFVEAIEFRNSTPESKFISNGTENHVLTLLAEMAVDMGITDLADRHDFYAHGKLEE